MDNSIYVFISTIFSQKIVSYFDLNNSMYGLIYSSSLEFFSKINNLIKEGHGIEFLNKFLKILPKDNNIVNFIVDNFIQIFLVLSGILTILGVIFYGKKLYKYVNRLLLYYYKIGNCTLKIHEIDTINDLTTYMTLQPSFFENYFEAEKGDETLVSCIMKDNLNQSSNTRYNNDDFNSNLQTLCNMIIPKEGTKIIINDTKHGISGFMTFEKNEIEVKDYSKQQGDDKNNNNNSKKNYSENSESFSFNYPSVELSLKVNNVNEISNYIDKINEYVEENCENKLKSYNVMGNTTISKDIGLKTDVAYKNFEKLYIDTFFHDKRDELWSYIKKIHHEPTYFTNYGQPAVCNLLLYGPPGTGKSSFAYRIAKALGREVITFDLRDFENKQNVIEIFDDPKNCVSWRSGIKSSNCVYVLDEFDISIKYLYARQQEEYDKEKKFEKLFKQEMDSRKKISMARSNMFKNKQKTNNNDTNNNNSNNNDNKENGTITQIEYKPENDMNGTYYPSLQKSYGPQMYGQNEFGIDELDDIEISDSDSDSDNDSDSDEDNDNKSNKSDNDNDEDKDNNEKKKKDKKKKKKKKKKKDIFKKYAKADKFCLKDLLTVLQGPIPTEGRIIIATTNDYEGIKKLCPELVRSGRMTPVLFDNLESKLFNKICKYYFNEESNLNFEGKMKIPTSEVMELCLRCKINNLSFEYFIEQIKEKNSFN